MSESKYLSLNGLGQYDALIKSEIAGVEGMISAHANDDSIHISDADRIAWNDADSKKHMHSNMNILDAITDILPSATADNNGAFLRILNGAWCASFLTDVSVEGA